MKPIAILQTEEKLSGVPVEVRVAEELLTDPRVINIVAEYVGVAMNGAVRSAANKRIVSEFVEKLRHDQDV